ncbi:MAG: replication-associated recombination protein A [Deltaproteobacteria bacterium]|jgi:putative ATPase|nr:replication-associated recombination protein A [Deltaproteobacteria bacterium]
MKLANEQKIQRAPLAERMRPRTLDEVLGQDKIIGPKSSFGQIIRNPLASVPSVIFWGPPGTGKTTLAQVIAATGNYNFVRLSGVLDGVAELRKIVADALEMQKAEGKPTLALVDEIHRFNKSQQDAFLPHVESGLLTVIGQTTENVSFRIRNALLSRMRVLPLEALDEEVIVKILNNAINDKERGLGGWGIKLEADAAELIAKYSIGDARRALNCLEWAAAYVRAENTTIINKEVVNNSFNKQPQLFDQSDDYHYDNISAFIKSMRGSDPDAALYYMMNALEGGEDPLFLTRRMIIFASEDCSCDPRALEIALNVDQAVQRVGMPEGRIPLAQGVVYLSCCAKSNASYLAMEAMTAIVRENQNLEIPRRIRNAPTDLMKKMGNHLGYHYPHNYPGGFYPERYLPDKLGDLIVYEPTDRGLDAQIKERLTKYRELIKQAK